MTDDEREQYLAEEDANVLPELAREASSDPLPCPFCGGKAKIFTRGADGTSTHPRKLYWYVCNTYGCGVGVTHGEWSEQGAREKWNKRAS